MPLLARPGGDRSEGDGPGRARRPADRRPAPGDVRVLQRALRLPGVGVPPGKELSALDATKRGIGHSCNDARLLTGRSVETTECPCRSTAVPSFSCPR